MTRFPDIVQVHVETLRLNEGDEVIASVRDMEGNMVTAGGRDRVHAWLTDNGYEWVTAFNGIWRLAGHVQKTSREEWR